MSSQGLPFSLAESLDDVLDKCAVYRSELAEEAQQVECADVRANRLATLEKIRAIESRVSDLLRDMGETVSHVGGRVRLMWSERPFAAKAAP